MSTLPVPVISGPALPERPAQCPTEDPVLAYLGSLSPRSRITVQERLHAVAGMMRVPYEDLEWHELRAYHVESIRLVLLQ